MGIQRTGDKKKTGAVAEIKAQLAADLVEKGLPEKTYLVVLHRMPSAAWLKENGVTLYGEGTPIPGKSKGGVMYNYQGKGEIAGEEARLGGNCFLKNIVVDEATHKAWVTAKAEEAKAYEQRKMERAGMSPEEIALAQEQEALEAGETV